MEAMFKHILVPVDLSGRNAPALKTALALARLSRARVTLLHVVQRIEKIPIGELREFYKRLTTMAEAKLGRAARPFTRQGVPVTTEARIGEPATEIVRIAGSRKVDLIVMISHRVNPRRGTRGWGTMSYKVGLLCQCPILLVK
jgi:universal stress protein A